MKVWAGPEPGLRGVEGLLFKWKSGNKLKMGGIVVASSLDRVCHTTTTPLPALAFGFFGR